MRNVSFLVLICMIGFAACTTPFKKTKDGTEYKIITGKNSKRINKGNFIEMNIMIKYGDSLLLSTIDDGMPQYFPYDTAFFPPLYKEVFKNIHLGDSIIVKIPTDSLIAKGEAAPFMQKGKYLFQHYKIDKVFKTKEEADSAQNTHVAVAKERAGKKQMAMIEKNLETNKDQISKDSKIIEDYLAKNNIKATKTKWGTYIAILAEGSGDKITSNDVATVNYTGKDLDSGKVFDSNIDPKFGHVEPYKVNLAQPGTVIIGWSDALLQLRKASKATIYIPSTLAYGKTGNQGIKPDQILFFDIDVIDVQSEEMAIKKAQEEKEAMQQKMMDAQRPRGDSAEKTK